MHFEISSGGTRLEVRVRMQYRPTCDRAPPSAGPRDDRPVAVAVVLGFGPARRCRYYAYR